MLLLGLIDKGCYQSNVVVSNTRFGFKDRGYLCIQS